MSALELCTSFPAIASRWAEAERHDKFEGRDLNEREKLRLLMARPLEVEGECLPQGFCCKVRI
ncbi:hypothetical protein [Shimia sp. MIT1388]|uniref:hypothetical protein n=1 Tax=Shimia sp. MIT1388 TaxID=3096992 RepID=UPI00399A4165